MRRNPQIEREIGQMLARAGLTLATAESCTGGMLGGRITSVRGSSVYYLGGIIAYSNRIKMQELGADPGLLKRDGAVSETSARQMAIGVKARFGADFGVGITGIAGPTGGTPEKPVGLVYIGLASRDACIVREFHFKGNRNAVRKSACIAALEMLRIGLSAGALSRLVKRGM